jgi:hypothetical protein
MDRPVQIDVALISKITGLPTFGAQPEEYLDNKAREGNHRAGQSTVWHQSG